MGGWISIFLYSLHGVSDGRVEANGVHLKSRLHRSLHAQPGASKSSILIRGGLQEPCWAYSSSYYAHSRRTRGTAPTTQPTLWCHFVNPLPPTPN
ncbi:hypothetical protein PAMA_008844 [Pampus argenteus]